MKERIHLNIKSILLAEDDEDFFYFFKSAILSLCKSVNVWRTENGVMLLSLIETSVRPDLIFLDINMPLKNGIECLEEIKSNEKYKSTKVVMCSASGNKEDIDKCYDFGADYYFIKPDSNKGLVNLIKNLFTNAYFYKNRRPPREKFVLT